MSTFKLFETDMKVPCDTFQCHERAAYFIGKEDAPKSMLTKVCQKCADELVEDIMKAFPIYQEPKMIPFEDESTDVLFLFDKPVSEWTVTELKAIAKEKEIEGRGHMNKAELVKAINEAVK